MVKQKTAYEMRNSDRSSDVCSSDLKKIIEVTVGFSLPVGFRFRKGLEPLQRLGPNFLIRKSWALNRQRRPEESVYLVTDGNVVEGGDQLASAFLSLIIFRYIPNQIGRASCRNRVYQYV